MTNRTVHVGITGRVQGVGYRAWTEDRARDLRLTGWVRNRRDGSVEAVFSGNALAVAQMLEECETGPPAARVEGVAVKEHADDPHDDGASFRFRKTTE